MKEIVQLTGPVLGLVSLAMIVLNVIMALAVNRDAKLLKASHAGLYLFSPFLWGLIVFVFSLAGLAVYWAIHHSTLRPQVPPHARRPGL